MNIKTVFLVVSVLLTFHSFPAKAQEVPTATLTSAALWATAPNKFTCSLTNITNVEHRARYRIISEGIVLKESYISLAGKHTLGLEVEGFANGGYMYCEFTVEGQKAWYRGVAKLYRTGGDDFIAIPAY